MRDIVARLAPLNRAVCSPDYDRAIDYLRGLLPFEVLETAPDDGHNGWVIPPHWEVTCARIEREGRMLYDGTRHPLGVIALSAPFRGRVSREVLRAHLHFDHRFPDALPYHYRQQFRSWHRDWGFGVPRTLYDALEPGEYEVTIETREAAAPLRLLELRLPGTRRDTIAVCANLDHAGQANDGVSGVAVGVELFRRLARRPRRFSYVLVLCQGIIGSEFYLARHAPKGGPLFEALCLWMLGSATTLAVQESRGARSNLERALVQSLAENGIMHRRGAFEEIIVNDEYVWEAHGVPTTSLSRFPFNEYHSSRDTIDIISEESLAEAADAVDRALLAVEATPLVRRAFSGTVCLSNPRYGLYVDAGQVALGDDPDPVRLALRRLMDFLPSLTEPTTVASLAARFGLAPEEAERYLRAWERKGLLTLD